MLSHSAEDAGTDKPEMEAGLLDGRVFVGNVELLILKTFAGRVVTHARRRASHAPDKGSAGHPGTGRGQEQGFAVGEGMIPMAERE